MNDDAMPRDPDLDELPEELAEQRGPLWISGIDPDNGEMFVEPITPGAIASTLADERRRREADEE